MVQTIGQSRGLKDRGNNAFGKSVGLTRGRIFVQTTGRRPCPGGLSSLPEDIVAAGFIPRQAARESGMEESYGINAPFQLERAMHRVSL
jgi:hypothetical protein